MGQSRRRQEEEPRTARSSHSTHRRWQGSTKRVRTSRICRYQAQTISPASRSAGVSPSSSWMRGLTMVRGLLRPTSPPKWVQGYGYPIRS
jgi:hypothetical protein